MADSSNIRSSFASKAISARKIKLPLYLTAAASVTTTMTLAEHHATGESNHVASRESCYTEDSFATDYAPTITAPEITDMAELKQLTWNH